jgi:hypothetical protein
MKKLASISMASGPVWALRAGAAIALTVASFVVFRNRYHGDCLIPGYYYNEADDLLRFLIFPALFLVGFIWALSELVYPWLLLRGRRPSDARLLSVWVALAAYTAVAFVAWMVSPVPIDDGDDKGIRALTSVFWSVRILAETGNFSYLSCGY